MTQRRRARSRRTYLRCKIGSPCKQIIPRGLRFSVGSPRAISRPNKSRPVRSLCSLSPIVSRRHLQRARNARPRISRMVRVFAKCAIRAGSGISPTSSFNARNNLGSFPSSPSRSSRELGLRSAAQRHKTGGSSSCAIGATRNEAGTLLILQKENSFTCDSSSYRGHSGLSRSPRNAILALIVGSNCAPA